MKKILRLWTVTMLLFFACAPSAWTQSLQRQMQNFFSYNDNQAYWWLSLFAHPTNTFEQGDLYMRGDYVFVTIISSGYRAEYKIHKNGAYFDFIEVLSDNDFPRAFTASNVAKNLLVSFWRDYDAETIDMIEEKFGSLDELNSKTLCLAVLTALLWDYPY